MYSTVCLVEWETLAFLEAGGLGEMLEMLGLWCVQVVVYFTFIALGLKIACFLCENEINKNVMVAKLLEVHSVGVSNSFPPRATSASRLPLKG